MLLGCSSPEQTAGRIQSLMERIGLPSRLSEVGIGTTAQRQVILDHVNRLHVGHITMEFTDPGTGDLAVLEGLRPDLHVGLGCVSVTPGRIDSVEDIVSRVHAALRHLAPERITLNPDCGFAPGSGARVDLDEVYVKLRNEVEAARQLRAEL